jgi:hypothetical protein
VTDQRVIRIGGASGFWGDSGIATPQLLAVPDLDYLVFDYLAEITMSIMARARARNPDTGYAGDFVAMLANHLPEIAERKIKVVSNAGGVNPTACAKALRAAIAQAGLSLKVGVVSGDDVRDKTDELRRSNARDMFSGAAFPDEVLSANAYLGAFPIAAALDKGADIVITGRVVDSATTLGPCIHEFGWSADDYDRLAAGSLAGHILECGAQAVGGIHTDWEATGDWANIGYPIAAIQANGSFDVSKPANTGGLVSVGTVSEQLVYEIGDPHAYLLPDVTCDFTEVTITQQSAEVVRVAGARGRAPSDCYKASVTYADGNRVGLYLTVIGLEAARKARKVGQAVIARCDAMLAARGSEPYREVSIEIIGAEAAYGPHGRADTAREVVLKIAAKHADPKALELLVREATSSGTSMAPGITNMGGNRPRVSPLVRLYSCLIPKAGLQVDVEVDGHKTTYAVADGRAASATAAAPPSAAVDAVRAGHCDTTVPLITLAWGRSGDKGNDVNIGIIARRAEFLPYIRAALTAAKVAEYFAYSVSGEVERFDLPGINAVNFLLRDALDGGGIASLRNDPQGKGHAQLLLDYPIPVPASLSTVAG